jgi:peptidyl-prolyl cis-trans isomerase C
MNSLIRRGLIAAFAITGCATAHAQQTPLTVNGEQVDPLMLQSFQAARAQQGGDPQTAMEEFISQELLVQEAIKAKLDQEPDVALTLEIQRRNTLASAALRDYVAKHPPTEEALKADYEAAIAEMSGTEYKARHILLENQDDAVAVIASLDDGASFEELAKEKSTGPSGPDGGDLGWFTPDRMVKPFSDAAVALEPGKYSAEPVQTQFGWHVILLEETREAEPPTFESMRPELLAAEQRKSATEYLTELRESAEIETE